MTAPAEQLRAAAEQIRQAASNATPGPWCIRVNFRRKHPSIIANIEFITPTYTEMVTTKRAWGLPDAQWKALMCPEVAEPLAAWLDSAAKQAGKVTDPRNQEAIADPHALALARAILGEAP